MMTIDLTGSALKGVASGSFSKTYPTKESLLPGFDRGSPSFRYFFVPTFFKK
jgi:hypothetical protein